MNNKRDYESEGVQNSYINFEHFLLWLIYCCYLTNFFSVLSFNISWNHQENIETKWWSTYATWIWFLNPLLSLLLRTHTLLGYPLSPHAMMCAWNPLVNYSLPPHSHTHTHYINHNVFNTFLWKVEKQ